MKSDTPKPSRLFTVWSRLHRPSPSSFPLCMKIIRLKEMNALRGRYLSKQEKKRLAFVISCSISAVEELARRSHRLRSTPHNEPETSKPRWRGRGGGGGAEGRARERPDNKIPVSVSEGHFSQPFLSVC